MLADIEEFGTGASRVLLDRCLEAANHIADLVADTHPETEEEALAAEAASEAADMLLLMTLENSDDVADDAIRLILQVKRDLDVAVAA